MKLNLIIACPYNLVYLLVLTMHRTLWEIKLCPYFKTASKNSQIDNYPKKGVFREKNHRQNSEMVRGTFMGEKMAKTQFSKINGTDISSSEFA